MGERVYVYLAWRFAVVFLLGSGCMVQSERQAAQRFRLRTQPSSKAPQSSSRGPDTSSEHRPALMTS